MQSGKAEIVRDALARPKRACEKYERILAAEIYSPGQSTTFAVSLQTDGISKLSKHQVEELVRQRDPNFFSILQQR